MRSPRLQARRYQRIAYADAIDAIVNQDRNIILDLCVAAGKTNISLGIVSYLVQEGIITHVVAMAPNGGICYQFSRSREPLEGFHTPFLSVEAFEGATGTTLGERLISYLGRGNPGKFYVATYNLIVDQGKEGSSTYLGVLFEKLGSKLLVILDEYHHVHQGEDGNKISAILNRAIACGVRAIGLSGTPVRSDERELIDLTRGGREPFVIKRSLSEHMIAGFAPQQLLAEVVYVDGEGVDLVSNGEKWEGVPINIRALAQKMYETWVRDGRPYTLVRAMVRGWKDNEALAKAVTDHFRKQENGNVVCDATKDDGLFEELLRTEEGATECKDLTYVIFTFRRMDEGVDSPCRSHLFLQGCPSANATLVQLIGRVMRSRYIEGTKDPKYAGYPTTWLNASKVVFFISKDQPSKTVGATLLNAMTYISSFRDLHMFHRMGFIHNEPYDKTNEPGPGPGPVTGPDGLGTVLDPDKRARIARIHQQVKFVFDETKSEFPSQPLRTVDWVKLIGYIAREEGEPIADSDIRASLALICAANNPKDEALLRSRMDYYIKSGKPLFEAFVLAAKDVFKDFEKETLIRPDLYQITGELADKFSRRLIGALQSVDVTEEYIFDKVDAHRSRNEGRFPELKDDFAGYHRQLLRGSAKLPQLKGGLPELLIKREGRTWVEGLRPVIMAMAMRGAHSPSVAKLGTDTSTILAKYRTIPEVVYFPRAWKALYMYSEFASKLPVAKAHRLGSMSESEVRRILKDSGEEGLLSVLGLKEEGEEEKNASS